MKCRPIFRSDSPHKLLQTVFNEQVKFNSTPKKPEDFVHLKSSEIIMSSGLTIAISAMYTNLTRLAECGRLAVHSNPDHSQGFMYSITLQGIHCCRCRQFDMGSFETESFQCGPIEKYIPIKAV